MRVDLKKVLFVGVRNERELFFRKAQELGLIHFIDPKPGAGKQVPTEVHDVSAAIKVLRGLPVVEQEETEDYTQVDGIVGKILQLKNQLDKLGEAERVARLEIARVEPLGDFSIQDIEWIEKATGKKIQFYCAKEGFSDGPNVPASAIFLNSDYGLDYFMALNDKPAQFDKMIEMKVDHPIGELKDHYQQILHETLDTEHELKGYAKYDDFLHKALIHKLNKYNLHTSESYVQMTMDDMLFAVEGWVPSDKLTDIHELAQHMHVYDEEVAIEPSDVVPTCLENEGLSRVGEDLVHIYDTPSTGDRDPSLWVLFFFALFFSMILGDAGYGLVLLLVSLYVRSKFKKMSKVGTRVMTLFTILCFMTIAWGLLTTSFFGISFSLDSPVRKVSLTTWMAKKKAEYHMQHQDEVWKSWVQKYPALENVTEPYEFVEKASTFNDNNVSYDLLNKFNDNIMLELALFIGVLHIIISFLRYIDKNLTGIGWIIFIVGAYLYFPYFMDATSLIHYVFGVDKVKGAQNGLKMMYIGIGVAVLISVFKNKILGLLEAMNIIQIFGDVMSYLRLYALGLSGSLVTATMNDLASGMNFVFGFGLLLIAHTVNIVLGIMGGVIHGLRLNFLEWYHYCFEGGGKRFNPLKKIEIE